MPKNVPPELEDKFASCKEKVIASGQTEEAAYGICYMSVVEGKSLPDATKAFYLDQDALKYGRTISAANAEIIKGIIALAKQLVPDEESEEPEAPEMPEDEMMQEKSGNALKSISMNDDELRVANYIVLFGGRDLTGFTGRKNRDGSAGESFAPDVDVESEYTKSGVLHVDFEHSQDVDGLGIGRDDVLGYVDWKTARKDDKGIFVERVLNRRNKYVSWLKDLIDAGMVGNSTEAIAEHVQKTADGTIKRWPLRRDTLTVTPMEPRMLSANTLTALKALSDVLPEAKAIVESAPPIDYKAIGREIGAKLVQYRQNAGKAGGV